MKYGYLFIALALVFTGCNKKATQFTDYVNPFIGTGGHGHTYPGAAVPFGMVQLSPDTRLTGWDGCSAYHYSDEIIYGFSHTHLSGTGCSDYGDILLMPVTGTPVSHNGAESGPDHGYASRFSHRSEHASPGYYQVKLSDYSIAVRLTATERVGVHSYTYPKNSLASVIIDLQHRDKVIEARLEKSGINELSGFRRSSAWANDQHLYFVIRFSQPIDKAGLWVNDSLSTLLIATGENIKGFVQFEKPENKTIMVKVGLSPVSIEGARKNLEAEVPGWDFQAISDEAAKKWNQRLSKIKIKGGTKTEKTNFYTALYHSFLNPNLFMDVDGRFRGTDLKIHQAQQYEYHTVFSLWDTYRATHPLFTLLETEKTNAFIHTFLDMYRYGGKLPVWELAGNYTGCMIGYHAIPVIVDAWRKGIRDFDENLAMQAMVHSATLPHLGLPEYQKYGYIPSGLEHESVSKTLEYAYDDWCIAMMANDMELPELYKTFMERAQNYKNLFDPQTGFMRAKNNNAWFTPFDPREVNFNYTEANAWQYSFYVPHDVQTLIDYHGGDELFCNKLDELFSTNSETTGREQADITGLIGQYAHGNEPSHHMAYLYSYAGKPWKTQERVSKIREEMYRNAPDGLCGNEDCGQMSSWYVFSALGFYPVTPGDERYIIGTPLFRQADITLENGKTFQILAPKASKKNSYIHEVKLNGQPYYKGYITHTDIMEGGTLEFTLKDTPGTYGAEPEFRPSIRITDHLIEPVPFVQTGEKAFFDSTQIVLATITPGSKVYYTTDLTEPNENSLLFATPLTLSESTTIKAISIAKDNRKSRIIESQFLKIPQKRKIKLYSNYANQYSAGGDYALIDHLHGNENYKTGRWQGFEGQDLRAEIDLGEIMPVAEIETGFLQDENSWIFMPHTVEYYIATQDDHYVKIATLRTTTSPRDQGTRIEKVSTPVNQQVRYIKIVAKSRITNPEWHKAPGEKCWIFADEISIN
ncbi:MAG: GH92 family glycosyl hydrolase [Bacteroidales bacterium]|nr:GH92 family glycosyl hydrolase [Bacteroidales bacterium]MDD2323244.1 GH92 family glycosyl hydrolase [Bacteroidales bacterium]MDD3961235.1 GH92 family glycosyl hydrolase [Bacteroidales bacterium]MDY0285740.1 GH92 family glycosyl hydrolase [Bacteroidales bacterium]HPE87295.1 GH92 family glycosyl hydrolase [Bacteroidales bacterium]